jgi:hypothetical protein
MLPINKNIESNDAKRFFAMKHNIHIICNSYESTYHKFKDEILKVYSKITTSLY